MIGKIVKKIAVVAMVGVLAFAPVQAQSSGSDFSYTAVTPGAWVYRAVTGGSEAAFIDSAGATRAVISCGKVTRLVTLSRTSAIAATSLSFWTSSATRQFTARFDQPTGRVIAQIGASDAFLDALVFSRGKFAVMTPGSAVLVVPVGTEVAHVVEDCRT